MDTTAPKYTRWEYERRFLVDAGMDWRSGLQPYSKLLQDRYLACGRLRLRRLEDSDTGRVAFKLTKKFESPSRFGQPIVSVWLSETEYRAMAGLPGRDLRKIRYYQEFAGSVFSIDVFQEELAGLVLCETEAESMEALQAKRFPSFARWEVTEEPFFTGGCLCAVTHSEMEREAARIRGV